EDGIRDGHVTGVQTCALPISCGRIRTARRPRSCAKNWIGLAGRCKRKSSAPANRAANATGERFIASPGQPDPALAKCKASRYDRSEERRVGKECSSWGVLVRG